MRFSNTKEPQLRRADLIEPQLSYEIVGVLFDVFEELGAGRKESLYERAVRVGFEQRKISFKEQIRTDVYFHEVKIGIRIFDFLVADRIVLELKASGHFRQRDYEQVKQYLITANLPLAILARFGVDGVVFKRVLRPLSIS